jgi:hypothetical protein
MTTANDSEAAVRAIAEFVLSTDATVSYVLRAHLMAESILEKILCIYLPKGEQLLKKGRLTFAQKLEVVAGLDAVLPVTYGAVKALNKLRNKLVHKPHDAVGDTDILLLLGAIGREPTKSAAELKEDRTEALQGSLGGILGMLNGEHDAHVSERRP